MMCGMCFGIFDSIYIRFGERNCILLIWIWDNMVEVLVFSEVWI